MSAPTVKRALMGKDEIAAELGIVPRVAGRHLRAGTFGPSFIICRRRFVTRTDWHKFIERRRRETMRKGGVK